MNMAMRGAIAALIMSLLLVYGTLLMLIYQPSRPAPPMVTWVDSQYVPGAFCPGDTVREIVTVEARDRSAIVVLSTFVRAGPNGDNAQIQRLGDAAVVIVPSPRVLEDQDPTWIVPDLPPGDYVRAIAAGTLFRDTEPVFREQPFTIRADCPQK